MKRTLSAILALLLAASMFSCSNDTTEGKTDENQAQTTTAETEAVETDVTVDIPDVMYEGEEFRILYRFESHAYNITDIWVEGLNGEVINDAVYNRNLALENKFGLEIVSLPSVSPVADVKKNIQAQDDFCEIFADRMYEAYPLTLENYMYNWNDIDYVDFNKPWWDSNAASDLAIGDQLYIMGGDFSMSTSGSVTCLLFNKKLMTDYSIELPYQLVYDGKWTIDKMIDMIKMVGEDLDGNGKMNADDRFGMLTQVPYKLLAASGISATERDGENYPILTPINDRMTQAMTVISELLNDKANTIAYEEMAKGQNTSGFSGIWTYCRSKFATDQILFFEGGPACTAEFTNMESPYGLLVMPKMDEQQERYYHLVDEYCCGWSIPSNISDTEKVGIVMEYMAYASSDLVEAFYEITLKGKRADAPEDSEMLDLIRSTAKYEISYVAGAGIRQLFEAAVKSGNLASEYAKNADAIQAKLDECKK